eukprot:tig00020723_g13500.t1
MIGEQAPARDASKTTDPSKTNDASKTTETEDSSVNIKTPPLLTYRGHANFHCMCTRESVCDPCKELSSSLQSFALPSNSEAELRKYAADLKAYVEHLGPKHALSAASTIRLAYLHWTIANSDRITAGERQKAQSLGEAATLARYAEDERLLAGSRREALADHAEALAAFHSDRNDAAAVKRVLLWALYWRQGALGPAHEKTVRTEYLLGVYLEDLGEPDSAEAYFKSAFAHERESGNEGRIAKAECCDARRGLAAVGAADTDAAIGRMVVGSLVAIGKTHVTAGRFQRASGVLQMASAIAERVCDGCAERCALEGPAMALVALWSLLHDFDAAEEVLQRLIAETERRLGAGHCRVGFALVSLARCQLAAGRDPVLIAPSARRGWSVLVAALGPTSPEVGEELVTMWALYEQAPSLDPGRAVHRLIVEWTRANGQAPPGLPAQAMLRIMRGEDRAESEGGAVDALLAGKLEQRKREREERKRAEEERERAQREAERAERVKRDASEREAAQKHMKGSQWAPARKLLDALLKRSPDDFEARLLRIQCTVGAGQLEAAGKEAEKAERELAGSGASADVLRRVQEQRRNIAAELLMREEAKEREVAKRREEAAARRREEAKEAKRREEARRREEEEARRRAQEEQRERERQAELQRQQQLWREEQERREARRREQEQRQEERRREEEARRQAAEAERRREEEEEERRREEQQRRREEERRAAPAARKGAAPCRFFAAGFCRDGARCRFQHGAPAPAAPAEAGPSSGQPAQVAACRFFARGSCRDGARCRYRHEAAGPSSGPAAAPRRPSSSAPSASRPWPPARPPPPSPAAVRPAAPLPPAGHFSAGLTDPADRFHGPCIDQWRTRPLADGCPPASPATSDEGLGAGAPASPLGLSAPPARPTRPYRPPGLFAA